jgi:tyrosinase
MTLSQIVVATRDELTCVRSAGVEAVLQVQGAVGAARRIYLVLENVRGSFDATVLRVFLKAPAPDAGSPASEVHLGSHALYGLRSASVPRADGQPGGLQCQLDVTPQSAQIAAALAGQAQLRLSILPHQPLPDGVEITIDRIRMSVEAGAANTP